MLRKYLNQRGSVSKIEDQYNELSKNQTKLLLKR